MTTKYLQISLSVAQLLVAPTSQIHDGGGIMEDGCFFIISFKLNIIKYVKNHMPVQDIYIYIYIKNLSSIIKTHNKKSN